MRLDPAVEAASARLITYDSIGSTNEEALRLARAGERGPLWITAARQTAGRGRRGRVWVSEPGNLYASLLLTGPSAPEHFPELSFVAALALYDALVQVCLPLNHSVRPRGSGDPACSAKTGFPLPRERTEFASTSSNTAAAGFVPVVAPRLALKWPNDLLLDRKKLAGILVEGEGATVVIGIGVNCVHHPDGTDYPATDLAAAGLAAAPAGLFAPLTAAAAARLTQWRRGAGFSAIRADWLGRAADLGGPLRVRTAEGELAGTFETIDASGRLVLRGADGTMQAVAAGDVLLAR